MSWRLLNIIKMFWLQEVTCCGFKMMQKKFQVDEIFPWQIIELCASYNYKRELQNPFNPIKRVLRVGGLITSPASQCKNVSEPTLGVFRFVLVLEYATESKSERKLITRRCSGDFYSRLSFSFLIRRSWRHRQRKAKSQKRAGRWLVK